MSNPSFVCGIMETMNGRSLRALTPDANGAYTICIGAIDIPTRNDIWYDTESLLSCMNDTSSRFNICLKDGCLAGEWGHPVVKTREDMDRLIRIDESKVSHYFHKIWIDTDHPVTIKDRSGVSYTGYPIMAKVKPYGPYGRYLEDSLRDPCHNTSFSIRSVCIRGSGPNPRFEYRHVKILVTWDAVHAPGYEVTNKRYAGLEDFKMDFSRQDLEKALASSMGMEAVTMVTDKDVLKLFAEDDLKINDQKVGIGIAGHRSITTESGDVVDAATLLYKRRGGR